MFPFHSHNSYLLLILYLAHTCMHCSYQMLLDTYTCTIYCTSLVKLVVLLLQ